MEDLFGRTGARDSHSRHRWALALRGAAALMIGIILLAAPLGGLVALVALAAILFVIDGLISLAMGLWHIREDRLWWIAVLQGVASLFIATLALSWPSATLLALVWLTAAWAIWQGVTDIMIARGLGSDRWLAIWGAVSVALGIVMIAMPVFGVISLALVIALYAVVRGIGLLAAAWRGRQPARIAPL